jgi:gamma-glutamyltranspeptidase / glutathione hydrolase
MVAMRLLLSGGNAFDAATAAGFAAAVIEPTASYSLCSECVAMVHIARNEQTLVLSGQGPAPALATIGTFTKKGFQRIPTGPGPNAHRSGRG